MAAQDTLDLYKKYGVSLNLGGGGARGMAHLGVLRALQDNAINFDLIVGVSMGAIVGANYALNPNIDVVEKKLVRHIMSDDFQDSLLGSWKPVHPAASHRNLLLRINRLYRQTGLFSRLLLSNGILSEEDIERAVYPLIPDVCFEDLKLPFVCTAVSLEKGEIRIFHEGPIRPAVLASISMPLVFPPVSIDNCSFVDGGILDRIGIETSQTLGVKDIIAVDVSAAFLLEKKVRTGIDVMMRSEEIAAKYRKQRQLNQASVVISPIEDGIHWADHSQYERIIKMGYDATLAKMEFLKRTGRSRSFWSRLFNS